MAKVHVLRALVEQRLSAAVEEIFVLFERTVAEYEEQLCRSEQEKQRQRKLLEAVLTPQVLLQRTDDQQLQVESEEFSPEQQEWISSLDQEDPPEPPHIKEEQEEELWTSQEQEQLQGLEETESTKVTFTPVPVKSEGDEEYPQSSHLRQSRTENKGAEPPASSSTEHMITGTDGEDCGGPGPELDPDLDRCLGPDTDVKADGSPDFIIEISNDEDNDEKEMKVLNGVKNNVPIFGEITGKNTKRPVSYSVCGQTFGHERDVGRHMVSHAGERPYSCSVCGKTFSRPTNLKVHMMTHTEEKPFSCFACGKTFKYGGNLQQHMTLHTGEILAEPFTCSTCGKTFLRKDVLKSHMITHTGEKPFGCSQCGKTFGRKTNLKAHMRIHTGEKRFSCSVCHKRFTWHHQVKSHQCVGRSAECGGS